MTMFYGCYTKCKQTITALDFQKVAETMKRVLVFGLANSWERLLSL